MASQSKVNVDDVVKAAKDMIENFHPSMKEMSREQIIEIDTRIRKQVSDALQMTNLLNDAHQMSDTALVEKMKKLLSEEDFKRTSGYVDQETYTMEVTINEATVHREGQQFRAPFQLTTLEGIADSRTFQIVSLVVECVFFVLGVIGFKVHVSKTLMNRIIEDVEPLVRTPAFTRYVNEFIETWGKGGAWNKAKAIFKLVKETNSAGIFMKIVKLAFKDMPWYDKVITIAAIAAQIAAAFATDGIALIAKLALCVNDAYNITKKVINLTKLSEMHAAFSK